MLRNNQSVYSAHQCSSNISTQTAFHEAGHVAGIYIGNQQKKLPAVFFQIQIEQSKTDQIQAKVIDGHLISNPAIFGLSKSLPLDKPLNYKNAYEADIVNLLVGPLAEARYVAIRDNEEFSFDLLIPDSLHYYGGTSDLEKAEYFLENLIESKDDRDEKMFDLFFEAFNFVNNNKNWKAIKNLANHILETKHETISCEEAISALGY